MAKITNRTKKTAISLAISTVSVTALVYDSMDAKASIYANTNLENQEVSDSIAEKYLFLSDIGYLPNLSQTAWGNLMLDANIDGGTIALRKDGEVLTFEKGLGAHATSTLVFDVSEYSDTYSRFTTYAGIDNTQAGRGNGVIFTVYTSEDGNQWDEVYQSGVINGNNDTVFIDVDIKGAKYLKLYAYDNGGNGSDHAVYGSARLLLPDYDISSEYLGGVLQVSDYDVLIKAKYNESGKLTDEIKNLILQRKFIERVGFHTLQKILLTDEDHMEAVTWLLNNPGVLELYIMGGEVESGGSYITSMDVFTELYKKHYDDFSDSDHGEFYLKLAISLSLSHAKTIRLWTGTGPISDANTRYEIYKKNLLNGRIDAGGNAEIFENLPVELMRWVVDSQISDEEIDWLIDYSLVKKEAGRNYLDAYEYIEYTFDYNYDDPKFYSQDNYEMWNEKYNISALTGYGETGIHRLWMVFEDGSVCGGLAKTYANLGEVFGNPAAVIGQPGHGATLAYRVNEEGLGLWGIQNDISGFPESEKGERFPLGWGSQSWKSYYNVSYILLGQHALNNFETFIEAAYYNFLAEVYSTDYEKQIEIYNQALKIQNYNLDSLEGLIQAYKNSSNKMSKDYLELANRVADALTYFPLPFFDVMKLIEPMVTDDTDRVVFDMLRVKTLKQATLATSEESLQPIDCAAVARKLLGENQVELATFSFDGENAGKIMIDESYAESAIRWEYSLDNWKTKVQTDEKQLQLTTEELEKINVDDDIQISLVGTSEIYVIDITQHEMPTDLYANDLENQFRGLKAPLEYSDNNGAVWKDYDELNTRLTGDVTVQVRYKASGTSLSSEVTEYTFTEDSQPETRKYIPLENISLYMYSSQQDNTAAAAQNFIDGNLNTGWHNTWAGEELKYFSVELDQVRKISAIEYQNQAGNGNAKDLDIYTSIDGVNWVKVGEARNLAHDATLKVIELDKVIPAKYVMLHAVSTHGNPSNVFFTGRLLNLFEDTSMFSFSFDGENAGKITLDEAYKDLDIRWEYSLDGGKTKVETDSKELTLTAEELEKINENDGIQISIVGSSDIQIININKYEAPTDLYVNDLENQFRGFINQLEYSEDGGKTWNLYDSENTRFISNRTVQVRYQASGNKQHSEAVTYQFTEDNQPETRKYIPVENLSVYLYSSQETSQGQIAQNFIDGNINTVWHNTWSGEELKYFSVELDQLRYLSAIEYQNQAGNGNAKDLDIYTSVDGVTWEKVGEARNLTNDNTLKVIELDKVIPAKYVMVHAVSTYGSRSNVFFTGQMLNLFEDITKEQNIDVIVTYNIETLTNQDVIATINLPEGYKVVGENTHTFTENGTHTFTYYSPTGKEYTHIITVDWIDKEAPTATISYSSENKTNQNVTATLVLPEDGSIKILNNNGQATYEFTENGEFTFEIQDQAGNTNHIRAIVTWINKEVPVLEVVYSTMEETHQPVVATLITDNVNIRGIDSKVITVTNNNGEIEYIFTQNGEFTFEYVDDYGNVGSTTAKVDWIIESDIILPEEKPGDSDESGEDQPEEKPGDSDESGEDQPGDSDESDEEKPGESDESGEDQPGDSDESDEEQPGESDESGEDQPGDSDESDEDQPGDSDESGEDQPGDSSESDEEKPGESDESDEDQPGESDESGEDQPGESDESGEDQPGEIPDVPVVPEQPELPELPEETPDVPVVPEQPELPELPEETPDVPVVPEQPELPELPEETPDVPVVPEQPELPEETPDVPVVPEQPELPELPEETPDVPVVPEQPELPELPEQPEETPDIPVVPEQPELPELPEQPEETPDVPVVPEQPEETPDIPVVPEQPELPELPEETPDVPVVPEQPELPELPEETPDIPVVPEQPELPELPEETPDVPVVPEQPEETPDVSEQPELPELPEETPDIPVVPEQPELPELPEETPDVPVVPEQPELPELPEETPDVPVIPEQPELPELPEETPDVPEQPELPELPEETPDVPVVPEQPELPELPEETPDVPVVPEQPELPELPEETPDVPVVPEQPELPELPEETPDVPVVPEQPELPELPEETPDVPVVPEQPELPELPEETPDVPVVPEQPEETPDVPVVPEQPEETPDIPVVPEQPELPELPEETPDVPVVPEQPELPELPEETPDIPVVPEQPELPELPEETPDVPVVPEQPELPELPEETPDIPVVPDYIKDIIDISVVTVTSGVGTEALPLQLEIKDVMSTQLSNFINQLGTLSYQLVSINENDECMMYHIKVLNTGLSRLADEAYIVIKVNKSLTDFDNINQELVQLFDIKNQPVETPDQSEGEIVVKPGQSGNTDVDEVTSEQPEEINKDEVKPEQPVDTGTNEVTPEQPIKNETTESNQPETGYAQMFPLFGGALSTLIGMLASKKRKK